MKVFVSGSLIGKGRYHQYYLHGKIFLGKGLINEHKKYILGGLDSILPEKGARMQGEVYEVDAAALAKLDFLHNETVYTRGIVDVELENGETVQANAYIWNGKV